MTRAKPRRRYRSRPMHPEGWLSSITIGQIKQWLIVMVPIIVSTYAFAGPYVKAQAADYLKTQLVLIGMDPATVQTLNKNVTELTAKVEAKDEATKQISNDVQELKSQLGTVLELMKLQALKGLPVTEEPVK